MKVEVIYNEHQFENVIPWFLDGDFTTVSADTETMGRNWYEITKKLYHETNPKEQRQLHERLKEFKGEALSPSRCHLATLQLATADDRGIVLVLRSGELSRLARDLLITILAKKPTWLFHNAKFDFKQLAHHFGISFDDQKLHDTMLVETLILGDRSDESSRLRETYKRYDMPEGLAKGIEGATVSDWWTFPLTQDQIDYAINDVLMLRWIYQGQMEIINQRKQKHVAALENSLPSLLCKIESTGVRYAKGLLSQFLLDGAREMERHEDAFHEVFPGVNPNSSKQVLEAIQKQYGVTPMTSRWDANALRFTEVPSADKDTLLQYGLRHEPAISAMIAAKELKRKLKLAQTWMEDGDRFCPEFMQLKNANLEFGKGGGTRTGRMSSSPNIQNLDNFMKQFIEADDDWFIASADYSQIELRLMASYAEEDVLKQAFIDNRDPHTEMAAWAFQMPMEKVGKKSRERRIAKEVNFGFIYGMSGRKFATRVLRATQGEIMLSTDEGNLFRTKFFERYTSIAVWHRNQFAQACLDGFVSTRSGRRRYYNRFNRPADIAPYARLEHPRYGWFQSTYAPDWKWRNIAYNTPIQGTGGDGLKMALALLAHRAPWYIRPFATVHDSIDVLIHKDYIEEGLQILNDCMVEGMAKYLPDIPVVVETTVGKSWASCPNGWYDAKEKNPGLSDEQLIRKVEDDHGLWYQTGWQSEFELGVRAA